MGEMTKQHFEEIASIIREQFLIENDITDEHKKAVIETIENITFNLSDYFKTQNLLFNENQFKKACLE
jgi:hypothetical protein